MRSPFAINYMSLEDTIKYCQELGPSCVVIKVHGRPNYNITHKETIPMLQKKYGRVYILYEAK